VAIFIPITLLIQRRPFDCCSRGRLRPIHAEGGRRDAAFGLGLEEKVDRLALICCALFELIQASGGISEEQLRKKIAEVDLRDGTQDDRITPQAKKCPKCGAMMSPKFRRCLFCGHKDEASGMI
jgi:hypothetical protein